MLFSLILNLKRWQTWMRAMAVFAVQEYYSMAEYQEKYV